MYEAEPAESMQLQPQSEPQPPHGGRDPEQAAFLRRMLAE